MKFTIAVLVLAASFAPINVPAASAAGGRWRSLFDGKTTTGWRGYREAQVPDGWKVVDGALTRVAKGADLVTADEFGDFELTLQWKIAPGANSGILYRVTEEDPETWMSGPEYQVIDDTGYPGVLKPGQKTGADYDMYPPSSAVAKPAGSWNDTRILVRGNHVEHWLNGVKVVEYEFGSPDWQHRLEASKFKEHPRYARARQGRIALQNHGDWVAYRNIRIRVLH